jgi:hypothetical protein
MMDTKTQHGYLVLADISGYTSYLTQVELDHAHEILSDLLECIVGRFKTLLTLSKLEGDAVFAYAPETRVPRGETLVELVEATYAAFRGRVEAAHRRTTCECRACQAIPTLDLKFFLHHGDYIVQDVAGIKELVGSDVNLAHRLMKNHVSEATGWKAYLLFTQPAREHLGLELENVHAQAETYEHLGDVQTFSLDLRPRFQAWIDARRIVVSEADAHVVTEREYPASPAVLWDWLNDPRLRATYAFEPVSFKPVFLPGGRSGVGAKTHCVHGKEAAMIETILDWRPFDYFTVDQVSGPFAETATFELSPTPDGGTRLRVLERGRLTSIGFLDRAITVFMVTRLVPTKKLLTLLGQRIAEHSHGEAGAGAVTARHPADGAQPATSH